MLILTHFIFRYNSKRQKNNGVNAERVLTYQKKKQAMFFRPAITGCKKTKTKTAQKIPAPRPCNP